MLVKFNQWSERIKKFRENMYVRKCRMHKFIPVSLLRVTAGCKTPKIYLIMSIVKQHKYISLNKHYEKNSYISVNRLSVMGVFFC